MLGRQIETVSLRESVSARWKLVRHLARDNFSSSYEASDAGGTVVEVKVLLDTLTADEQQRSRFMHAKAVAQSVNHPSVVRVLDEGLTNRGSPYLVTERLVGETLEQRIRRASPLDVSAAVLLAVEILDALTAAHEAGFVHGNLSPASTFITSDGTIKLLDFGVFGRAASGAFTAVTAMRWGAPHFMAPEQMTRDVEIDERTDVWAVGALLFWLLTGEKAYGPTTAAEYVRSCATALPRLLEDVRADVPRAIASVVDGALQPRVANRLRSARVFAGLLRTFMEERARDEGAGLAATRPRWPLARPHPRRRGPRGTLILEARRSLRLPSPATSGRRRASSEGPQRTSVVRVCSAPSTPVGCTALHRRGTPVAAMVSGLLLVAYAVLAIVIARLS